MTRWTPLVGMLLGVVLAAPTCFNHEHHAVAAAGVHVRRVPERVARDPASDLLLDAGDYVLESPALRIVVAGARRRGQTRGALLHAAPGGAEPDESVHLLAPRLHAGHGSYPVQVARIRAVYRGKRPVLRLHGHAQVGRRRLEVVQDLALSATAPRLSLTTRVMAPQAPMHSVAVGARIDWGHGEPFVPGPGVLDDDRWHRGEFFASRGLQTSTLFAFAREKLTAHATFEKHGMARFLSSTDATSEPRDLDEGASLEVTSYLIVSQRGMGEALRQLGWARGAPLPEMLVTLPYRPAGAEVTLYGDPERPLLVARPDAAGAAIVPLLPDWPAELWLTATAYGHARSDPVRIPRQAGARVRLQIPEGGRIRVRAIDEESGLAMPARVRVMGVRGTESPDLGPDHRARGARDTVITMEGSVVIPAEPGSYKISVSHGPEWSLVERDVHVTKTFRPDVQASLGHVVRPRDWIPCDFHVHQAPSDDSRVALADRVASLVAEGIRFVVPTDHNHVTDLGPTLKDMQVQDVGTAPGVEISTWEPSFGHFNAFPFPLDPARPDNGAPEYEGTSAAELFAALRALDEEMVIQVNHPRLEPDIGYFDLVGFDPATGAATGAYSGEYDVLEVWNGFDLARPLAFERVFHQWLAMLARGERVVATGNSDSHTVTYQWAGYPRTYVWVEGGDPVATDALIRSLKAGRAMVTSGPMLEAVIEGRGPGETVRLSPGEATLRVQVQAPPWMDVSTLEVYHDGEPIVTLDIPPPELDPNGDPKVVRFDGDIRFAVRQPGFVVVMARGARPLDVFFGRQGILPIAFTNPIWLEVQQPPAPPEPGEPPQPDASTATPSGARGSEAPPPLGEDELPR